MKPLNHNSLYEYLIIAIVLQNAAILRSVNMMQALFESYGTLLAYDGKALYCFWKPEIIDGVTEEDLCALKVGYRAKSIKRVTGAFVRGEVDEFELREKSKEEQGEALLALYGIAPLPCGTSSSTCFTTWTRWITFRPGSQRSTPSCSSTATPTIWWRWTSC
jgi:3-methyladenine DNA glycosylase/8-oxoguanine DNA glycosylase